MTSIKSNKNSANKNAATRRSHNMLYCMKIIAYKSIGTSRRGINTAPSGTQRPASEVQHKIRLNYPTLQPVQEIIQNKPPNLASAKTLNHDTTKSQYWLSMNVHASPLEHCQKRHLVKSISLHDSTDLKHNLTSNVKKSEICSQVKRSRVSVIFWN